MTNDSVVDVLNNTQTYYSRCVGYCKYHKCFVSRNQIHRRRCEIKKCVHFDKIDTCSYWTERELKKQNKMLRRNFG